MKVVGEESRVQTIPPNVQNKKIDFIHKAVHDSSHYSKRFTNFQGWSKFVSQ
jgi:hypothetical protein